MFICKDAMDGIITGVNPAFLGRLREALGCCQAFPAVRCCLLGSFWGSSGVVESLLGANWPSKEWVYNRDRHALSRLLSSF
jgi:hypothetical protein